MPTPRVYSTALSVGFLVFAATEACAAGVPKGFAQAGRPSIATVAPAIAVVLRNSRLDVDMRLLS